MDGSVARRRIDAVLNGTLPMTALGPDEIAAVHAEIDERIRQGLLTTDYSQRLAAEGIATVALDDDGELVHREPDGTQTRL